MTDYNGEQNNIIGMAQPTDAQPIIPTEPQAAVAPVESQIAVSEAPVSDAPADIQVAVSEAPPTESVPINDAPASVQPTAPVYQVPAQIQLTAPQPPKNSKAPIFIGIGIFLVGVIIALVLVFVLVGNNDEDEKSKGNKTETEQTEDKPSSEDDNDEDEDNKDADEDKDNTDKDTSDKDSSSEDDKTDKGDEDEKVDDDDTPVDAVVDAPYAVYLDSFAGMFMGDLSGIGDILPKGMWNLVRFALSEELGYMPTKEEAVEIMMEEAFVVEGDEEEFLDKSGYTVISQEDVDEATIEKLQEGLANYMIFDEIEEAYKVTFSIDLEESGESISVEDTAYAVYVDDEWTFMSINYDIYIVDCTIFDNLDEFDDMFGEGFI